MKPLCYSLALWVLASGSLQALPTVYVGAVDDFLITTDAGALGLDAGDGVTWNGGAVPVPGLVLGTSAFTSLQAATAAVDASGTVHLASRTFIESGTVTIFKSLSLKGQGASNTILSGNDTHRVLAITDGSFEVVVEGMTIADGVAEGASQATGTGAGLRNRSVGPVTLRNVVVMGNSAAYWGGGVSNSAAGNMLVVNSTITANKGSIGGGGLCNEGEGTLTVLNSTVSANEGFDGGGLLSAGNAGKVVLMNATFSGNTATHWGGGLANAHGVVTLHHSTFYGNTAELGGGINSVSPVDSVQNERDHVTISNSIIAGNTELDTYGFFMASRGRNFIGVDGGLNHGFPSALDFTFASTNTVVADVLDIVLKDHGGPSKTHALVPCSPAINGGEWEAVPADAGDVDADANVTERLPLDQRGLSRMALGRVDLGALEMNDASILASCGASTYVAKTYTITTDSGAAGLSAGDIVTWPGGAGAVSGLVFGTNAFTSIQSAVDATFLNGMVSIAAGRYDEGKPITIRKNLKISGDSAALTIITGGHSHRVFEISGPGTKIDGIAIIEGAVSGEETGGGVQSRTRLTLSKVIIADNEAFDGGGIHHEANDTLLLLSSTILRNTAKMGAGIYNSRGSAKILNCTFNRNAATEGGALYSTGTMDVVNATFSRNTATNGAGIRNLFGQASLTNCTICYNVGDNGAGLHASDRGMIVIANSIVAGNIGRDVLGGPFTSNGANFIGDGSLLVNSADRNFANTSSVLSDVIQTRLVANGGPTLTYALAATSPARGQGRLDALPADTADLDGDDDYNEPLPVDQRGSGFPRVTLGIVDIGAVSGLAGGFGDYTSQAAYVAERASYQITVDNNVPGLSSGDVVTGSAGGQSVVAGLIFGRDAFLSIDDAVDATHETGTIRVAPGQYLEPSAILITKSLTIQGSDASAVVISGNHAHRVFDVAAPIPFTLANVTLTEGSQSGLYNRAGNVVLNACRVINNDSVPNQAGGGLHNVGTMAINRSFISQNEGAGGGGIYNEGNLSVTRSTLAENAAKSANRYGGAIYSTGILTVTHSTISNNTVESSYGGGVYVGRGIASLINTTLSGNAASTNGGGLYNANGSAVLTHCTVFGNLVSNDGAGAGVTASFIGPTRLTNSLVLGNRAGTIPSDVLNVSSNGSNFIGVDAPSASDRTLASTGTVVAQVLATTLADNAGPTKTHALVRNSPAIDFGNNAEALDAGGNVLTTDQRDGLRLVGERVDVGSVEWGGSASYAAWAAEVLRTGQQTGFDADADGDGAGNGYEFAIGSDGGQADGEFPGKPSLRLATDGKFEFAFPFRPGNTDLIWRVERSTDLVHFVEVYRYDAGTETALANVTAGLDPTDATRLIVRDQAPLADRVFYQLTVVLKTP